MKINKVIAILLALLIVGNGTPFFAALLQSYHGHHQFISTEIEAGALKFVFHHDERNSHAHPGVAADFSNEVSESYSYPLQTGDHFAFVSTSSPTRTSKTAKSAAVEVVFLSSAFTDVQIVDSWRKVPAKVFVYGNRFSRHSTLDRTVVLLI